MAKGFNLYATLLVNAKLSKRSFSHIQKQLNAQQFIIRIKPTVDTSNLQQLKTQLQTNAKSLLKNSAESKKGFAAHSKTAGAVKKHAGALRTLDQMMIRTSRNTGPLTTKFTGLTTAMGFAAKRFLAFSLTMGSVVKGWAALNKKMREYMTFESKLLGLSQATNSDIGSSLVQGLAKKARQQAQQWGTGSSNILGEATSLVKAGMSVKEVEALMGTISKLSLNTELGDDLSDLTKTIVILNKTMGMEGPQIEDALSKMLFASKTYASEFPTYLEGLKKSGSIFNSVGGDISEFIAITTLLKERTQKNDSQIGESIKSLITKMTAGGVYTKAIEGIGIDVFDDSGKQRQLLNIFREVGAVVETMSDKEVNIFTSSVGGQRRYADLKVLFENVNDLTEINTRVQKANNDITSDAERAQGTLKTRLTKTSEAWQELIGNMAQSKTFSALADESLTFNKYLIDIIDSLSKMAPLLAGLGAVGIASSIGNRGAFYGGRKGGKGFGRTPGLKGGIGRGMAKIGPYGGMMIGGAMSYATSGRTDALGLGGQVGGGAIMGGVAGSALGPMGTFAGVIVGAVTGIIQFKKSIEESTKAIILETAQRGQKKWADIAGETGSPISPKAITQYKTNVKDYNREMKKAFAKDESILKTQYVSRDTMESQSLSIRAQTQNKTIDYWTPKTENVSGVEKSFENMAKTEKMMLSALMTKDKPTSATDAKFLAKPLVKTIMNRMGKEDTLDYLDSRITAMGYDKIKAGATTNPEEDEAKRKSAMAGYFSAKTSRVNSMGGIPEDKALALGGSSSYEILAVKMDVLSKKIAAGGDNVDIFKVQLDNTSQAMRFLADNTARVSVLQDKLASATERYNAKLGLIETMFSSDRAGRQQLSLNKQSAEQVLKQGGDLRKVDVKTQQQALQHWNVTSNVGSQTRGTTASGQDIKSAVLAASVDKSVLPEQDEIAKLQKDLLNEQVYSLKVQQAIVAFETKRQNDFFTRLEADQKALFAGIGTALGVKIESNKTDIGQVGRFTLPERLKPTIEKPAVDLAQIQANMRAGGQSAENIIGKPIPGVTPEMIRQRELEAKKTPAQKHQQQQPRWLFPDKAKPVPQRLPEQGRGVQYDKGGPPQMEGFTNASKVFEQSVNKLAQLPNKITMEVATIQHSVNILGGDGLSKLIAEQIGDTVKQLAETTIRKHINFDGSTNEVPYV